MLPVTTKYTTSVDLSRKLPDKDRGTYLGSQVSRTRFYANVSPRYEAQETCLDAILYHRVSTLEPHPTGSPVYVIIV